MAGSGQRQVPVSIKERGVSRDINALQWAHGKDLTEMLAHFCLYYGTGEDGGSLSKPSTTTAPAAAMCLGGSLVLRTTGSAVVNVDVGTWLFVVTEADSAHSSAKLARGTSTNLTLTANASGSIRIDVIECQYAEVVSQELREVYDEAAQALQPQLVDKLSYGGLTYRIRTGTPGAGYPAAESGWTPIAVCSIPNGAVTWNDVRMWDVRPLMSDLHTMPRSQLTLPRPQPSGWQASAGPGQLNATGYAGTTYKEWLVGGKFDPDSYPDALNLKHANYLETGTTFVSGESWHLYLAFPFGLPRWAHYPAQDIGDWSLLGMRGIPILTDKVCTTIYGEPSGALTLPAGLGFTGQSANAGEATLLTIGQVLSTGEPCSTQHVNGRTYTSNNLDVAVVATSVVAETVTFDLPNALVPATAKHLRCRIYLHYSAGVTNDEFITITAGIGATQYKVHFEVVSARATYDYLWISFTAPVFPAWPSSASVTGLTVKITSTGAGTVNATPAFHLLLVDGWDFNF
jgi:hypothetical protein